MEMTINKHDWIKLTDGTRGCVVRTTESVITITTLAGIRRVRRSDVAEVAPGSGMMPAGW